MRLKDYGRNQRKRKEYIQQDALLLIGVDVSKSKHDACIGTLDNVKARIEFRNARDGFQRFACDIYCAGRGGEWRGASILILKGFG